MAMNEEKLLVLSIVAGVRWFKDQSSYTATLCALGRNRGQVYSSLSGYGDSLADALDHLFTTCMSYRELHIQRASGLTDIYVWRGTEITFDRAMMAP